jgi:hypothetical protein
LFLDPALVDQVILRFTMKKQIPINHSVRETEGACYGREKPQKNDSAIQS